MKFGEASDLQLQKINKLSRVPLTNDDIFVYVHKMAGDMVIPERYMQLTPALLNVFAANANNGVAFLLNHSWSYSSPKPALPYGRVFEGWVGLDGVMEGETVSFNGSSYIVRHQEKDNISTDSIISDIETGILFDTSIGWAADKFICSICGEDVRSAKCKHIPGVSYEIENGIDKGTQLCYAKASPPGYLMEDSAVFDGAYPGAGAILSAILSNGGAETPEGIFEVVNDIKEIGDQTIYGTYGSKNGSVMTFVKKQQKSSIAIPFIDIEPRTVSVSSTLLINNDVENKKDKGGDKAMPEVQIDATKENILDASVDVTIVKEDAEATDTMQNINEPVVEKVSTGVESETEVFIVIPKESMLKVLGSELSEDRLLNYAKIGMDYRNELIAETESWGVRALANEFKKEVWHEMLTEDSRTIDAIKQFREQFKVQAELAIPAGKQTSFNAKNENVKDKEIPDDFYKTAVRDVK